MLQPASCWKQSFVHDEVRSTIGWLGWAVVGMHTSVTSANETGEAGHPQNRPPGVGDAGVQHCEAPHERPLKAWTPLIVTSYTGDGVRITPSSRQLPRRS